MMMMMILWEVTKTDCQMFFIECEFGSHRTDDLCSFIGIGYIQSEQL